MTGGCTVHKVVVVGAGSWGTALAYVLDKNGHDVTLWSYHENEINKIAAAHENARYLSGVKLGEKMKFSANLNESMKDAEFIICAVPSRAVRETVEKFVPFVRSEAIIVNVSKGIEESSLLTLSDVIKDVLHDNEVAILSGPSHAEEVGRDIPTACVAAAENEVTAKKVQDLFMNENFRVYTNTDVIGIELGAAFKNIIALAAGMSDGLNFGDNTKAALMTRGISEIARLGVAMGGDVLTFNGLAGIGDLIVTCTSMHSRNRRAGILIGQGKSLDEAVKEVNMVVEGVNSARAAYLLCQKHNIEMPIVAEVNEILFHGKSARQAVMDLMKRDKKVEYKL